MLDRILHIDGGKCNNQEHLYLGSGNSLRKEKAKKDGCMQVARMGTIQARGINNNSRMYRVRNPALMCFHILSRYIRHSKTGKIQIQKK